MPNIDRDFLNLALELGLGERLARAIGEVEASLADFPVGADQRYRARLEGQRQALRDPELRILAALALSLCREDPAKTPVIRPAFARLAERHCEFAWLYAQLPTEDEIQAWYRRAG